MAKNGKKMETQRSVDQEVKAICDIMRRGNCAGAMQYVPELTWILFLRILDELEEQERLAAEAVGSAFTPSIEAPYRWIDWAAPDSEFRKELFEKGQGNIFAFVNGPTYGDDNRTSLLPYLKNLENLPNATAKQKVISEVISGVDRVRIDTERNFLDVLDKVDAITSAAIDDTHVFTLSQVYEGLLLKMGEKGNDGGQFFTPREVIRAIMRVVDPAVGDTVYDPGCGTGGFLAQAFEYMTGPKNEKIKSPDDLSVLKRDTFWGREKDNVVYPIALANLILHGIDKPNLWHGNTLTDQVGYGGLFEGAPPQFDVILSNPPFGGKEGKDAQSKFDYKTGATQVLFLQHVIATLKKKGRCGIVLDEGLLFRTNEDAFVKTKRKLLDDCNVWCIVSLPGGVFTSAGAGVKTNLVFFTKGERTKRIWYYDLTDIKILKKTPLVSKHFDEFFALLPKKGTSELSWFVDLDERRKQAAADAAPFKKEAEHHAQAAAQWNEKLKELKKAKLKDASAIEKAEAMQKDEAKESRLAAGKAKEIEDAVYDLKAVNPNRKQVVDARTPEDLLDLIEAKGREITETLSALKKRGQKRVL